MREKWVFSKKRRKDKTIFQPCKLLSEILSLTPRPFPQNHGESPSLGEASDFQGENSIFLVT
jgi:hypothetical protein